MAKQEATTTQFRRVLRRLNYERRQMTKYLEKGGLKKEETDYIVARSQTAPKTTIEDVKKTMLVRVTDPKKIPGLLGPVKRCVNNINKMMGRYRVLSKKLEKKGINIRQIEKEVAAVAV